MVRYIVGMMIEISRERTLTVDDLILKLNGKKNNIIYKSPSKGLFLKKSFISLITFVKQNICRIWIFSEFPLFSQLANRFIIEFKPLKNE